MVPIRLRHMLVLWAQLVSMSESRQVGSWRGAYLHPPQVRGVERLPAHMWGRAARLALAWALVPTFYSAERGVRSPCNRFLSRGRLGQPLSWSLKAHACLGTMRVERKESLSLHRDPA